MATTAASDVENPSTRYDANSKPPTVEDASITSPAALSDGGGVESNDKPTEVSVTAVDDDDGGAVTDIQKKMKRAERFGMTVQLSEEEKRNSRAERFGTATAVNGSDSSKASEELKKKARAERFGIVQSEPNNDGEAKKKARLARFGSNKFDAVEEEKKKARAIRFSQPGSGLNASGKGETEKTASTGKADEETK